MTYYNSTQEVPVEHASRAWLLGNRLRHVCVTTTANNCLRKTCRVNTGIRVHPMQRTLNLLTRHRAHFKIRSKFSMDLLWDRCIGKQHIPRSSRLQKAAKQPPDSAEIKSRWSQTDNGLMHTTCKKISVSCPFLCVRLVTLCNACRYQQRATWMMYTFFSIYLT